MRSTIAVDLGGTNIRVSLINEKYEMISYKKENTPHGDSLVLFNQIKAMIDEVIKDYDKNDIVSISFGVPGRVRGGHIIDELPNIGIKNVKIKEFFEKEYNLPIKVINDADAAVLAEARLGSGKEFSRVYFITISTGIGGALAVDGKLDHTCQEVGHTLFKYKNEYDEMEGLASGTGIIKLCKKNGLIINETKDFFDLIKANDKKALAIFEDWYSLLNSFIKFIDHEFKPDIICFTGGVFKSKDLFLDRLVKDNPSIKMRECILKEDAGILGSAIYGFEK